MQHAGDFYILDGGPYLEVNHEQNYIRFLNGQSGLVADGQNKLGFFRKQQSTGIYQKKLLSSPIRLGIEAISGDTSLVVNNGHLSPYDAIK